MNKALHILGIVVLACLLIVGGGCASVSDRQLSALNVGVGSADLYVQARVVQRGQDAMVAQALLLVGLEMASEAWPEHRRAFYWGKLAVSCGATAWNGAKLVR